MVKKIADKEFLEKMPTYFMGITILDEYIEAVKNAARTWGYDEDQVSQSVELTIQTLNRSLADVDENIYIVGKRINTASGSTMRYVVVSFKAPLSRATMRLVGKNLEETYENASLSDLLI